MRNYECIYIVIKWGVLFDIMWIILPLLSWSGLWDPYLSEIVDSFKDNYVGGEGYCLSG